jgi:hypothetical protein
VNSLALQAATAFFAGHLDSHGHSPWREQPAPREHVRTFVEGRTRPDLLSVTGRLAGSRTLLAGTVVVHVDL